MHAPKEVELYTIYLANQEISDTTPLTPEAIKVLDKFKDIFSTTLSDKLPPSCQLDHAIELVSRATLPC